MKFKKIISICLIISILVTSLCPISLAKTLYGPNGITSDSVNWKNLGGGYQMDTFGNALVEGMGGYSDLSNNPIKLETVEVGVTQSGIYNVTNSFGNGVAPTQFAICTKDVNGNLVPLPVSVYSSDGETGNDIGRYNNANTKTTSVYLEEGQTYYYVLVGEKGKSLSVDPPTEQEWINLHVEYITPREGEQAYATNVSSMKYTTPNGIEGINPLVTNYGDFNRTGIGESSLETISGDEVNAQLEDAAVYEPQEANAAWYEQILTWFVLMVADGLRAAIALAIGEDISIDSILFNEFAAIRLSLFSSSSKQNSYLNSSGMLGNEGVINKYFMLFRNIAIAVYLVMLLYMGVRVLLASTGSKKERYKTLTSDWVKGIIILAFFPYVMKYTIMVNDSIVEYIGGFRGTLITQHLPTLSGVDDNLADAMNLADSGAATNGDIMSTMRINAAETGRVAYAMIYLFLLKQMISFIYIYFKRLVSVIFLVVIFPLVTISYAVDKIGDGKSQAFNNWYKEFTLNVFMQAFQAINYLVVMSIINALTGTSGNANFILVLVGIEYVSKGDELLRGLFEKMSGGGANSIPRSLSEAGKTVAKVEIAKTAVRKVSGMATGIGEIRSRVTTAKQSYYKHQDKKHEEYLDGKKSAEEWWKNSIMNPEKHAIDDVDGNIAIALNLSGAHTGVEVKEALDRIQTALNDPNRRESVLQAYGNLATTNPDGSLNEADQERLDNLLMANGAINAAMNGNVGVKGHLTNREINVNAKILLDIGYEKDTGIYKDLYEYTTSQTMNDENGVPLLNPDGSNMTLADSLKKNANNRTIRNNEQMRMKNAQAFIGNVTGLDTTIHGTKGVTRNGHAPITTRQRTTAELENEANFARDKLTRFGTTNATGEYSNDQERAANLVARLQSYKDDMESGVSQGYTTTEVMNLVTEFNELSNSTDTAVLEILNNGGTDSSGNDISIEEKLGFKMEELDTMVSVAVVTNKAGLEGSEEEKQRMINHAGRRITEVATGKRFITSANGRVTEQRANHSKVSRTIVQRAELDDYIQKSAAQYKKVIENRGTANDVVHTDYIRQKKTQEEIRDIKEIEKARNEIEKDYDRRQVTSRDTRRQLFSDAIGIIKK